VNKRVLESLNKAGAFDSFGVPRAAMAEGLERAMEHAQRRRAEDESGQGSLFGGVGVARPTYRFPDVSEWPLSHKLSLEKEVLGLYLTGHPMEAFEADVQRFATAPLHLLSTVQAEGDVRVIGVPGDVRVVKTKRGDRMAFVQLEDARMAVECVFFSEPWTRSQTALKAGGPVLVTGRIEASSEGVKILATTAEPLEELRSRFFRRVTIKLRAEDCEPDKVDRLKALLEAERGSCELTVIVSRAGRYVAKFGLAGGVVPSRALEEGVAVLLGRPGAVEMR
jgi:DNA polymerase-3 subunit alpha